MAQQVVQWILNLGGNFQQKVQQAQTSLKALGATAAKVSQDLNQNQLLSQFESVASLLVQVGGPISQIGIIAATSARPLTVLGMTFGPVGIAAAAAAVSSLLFVGGAIKATAATKGWLDALIPLREKLLEQGLALKDGESALDEYAQASSRLELALGRLQLAFGEELAGPMTKIVDAATGLVNLFGKLADNVNDVADGLDRVLQGLGRVQGPIGLTANALRLALGVGDVAVDSLAQSGAQDPRGFTPNQGLVLPMSTKSLESPPGKPLHPVLEALADVRAGGRGSNFFEDGETIPELEAGIELNRYWQSEVVPALQQIAEDTDLAYQDLNDTVQSFKGGLVEATSTLEKFQLSAQGMSALSAGLGGGGVGGVVSAGVAGPAGMLAAMLLEGQTEEVLGGLFDQVSKLYKDLPDMIGDLIGEFIPGLISAAPEMAAAFTVIGPATALAIVENAPAIFSAVVDAILSLPEAFASAIKEQLTPSFFEKGGGEINPRGRDIGAALGGGAGFLFGGPVGALLGAGLGGALGDKADRGRPGIHIGQVVAPNPRELIRQLRESIGSFGLGETLNPFAS